MNILRCAHVASSAMLCSVAISQGTGLHVFDMSGEQHIQDIELGIEGDLYLAGTFNDGGDDQALVIHCDASGALLEMKTYELPGTPLSGTAICQRPDSGFWVTGGASGSSLGVFTLSLGASLAPITCELEIPFSWYRIVNFLTVTSSGAPIAGGYNTWVWGSFGWIDSHGDWFGPGPLPGQQGFTFMTDGDHGPDGSAYVGRGPNGGYGAGVILRYDTAQDLIYERGVTAPYPYFDYGRVCVGPAGSTVSAFIADEGSFTVIRYDGTGDTVWAKLVSIPDDDYLEAVRFRPDGRVLLLTRYNIVTHLTQISPAGEWEWTRRLSSPTGALSGMDLAVLSGEAGYAIAGSVLVAGTSKAFLMMTDTAGLAGTCEEVPPVVTVQPASLTPTAWTTFPSNPLGVSSAAVSAADPLANDSLVCGSLPVHIGDAHPQRVVISVTPNPFTETALVELDPLLVEPRTIELTDAFGKTVQRMVTDRGHAVLLRRDGLASGVYTLRALDGGAQAASVRVVIE